MSIALAVADVDDERITNYRRCLSPWSAKGYAGWLSPHLPALAHHRGNDEKVIQAKFYFGLLPPNDHAASDKEEEEEDEEIAQADNVVCVAWVGRVRRRSRLPIGMRFVGEELAAGQRLDGDGDQLVIWRYRRFAQQS